MMKHKLLYACLTLFIWTLIPISKSFAQCTIDSTQTIPGVYPDTAVDGVVFNAYNQDITFVMITDTLGFTITNYHITNVSGLPSGMSWVCNNSGNGCNYDPSVNLYGCVNISGTPLIAGTYIVNVTVVATLTTLGDQNINYPLPFTVLPDTVGNAGFSMTNSSGCAPLSVTFINNIPGQASYDWDFGNGVTDTTENPGPQTYSVPGDYVVTQSILPNAPPQYFLTEVTVSSVPDNYNDFGFLDPDPDLYFVLSDTSGNTIYDSRPATTDTPPPYTWTLPNISLDNQTYTLQVWDQDSLIVNLGDDDLGTITFAGWGVSGTATATLPGISGQLDLAYTIVYLPVAPVTYTDTVHVYATPAIPQITPSGPLTFCEGDSVTLVSSAINGNQWYDAIGVLLPSDTNAAYTVTATGDYYVVVTSPNGCSSLSALINVVVNPIPPKPTMYAVGDTIFCALTGYNLQWYLNGNILNGATSSYYVPLVDGTYSVVATDGNGCSKSSDPLLFQGVGITDLNTGLNSFEVLPNPSNGNIVVHLNLLADLNITISVYEITGRKVYQKSIEHVSGSSQFPITLQNLAGGTYVVELKGENLVTSRRMIVIR